MTGCRSSIYAASQRSSGVKADIDDLATRLSIAGEPWRRRLDAEIWPKGLPWERPVRVGSIDFGRVHAFALDQIDELLDLLLPYGAEGAAYWVGWHPDGGEALVVNLLTGAWDAPGSGRGGADLVSLVAGVGGISQGAAARWLAAWSGISGRRYA